MLLLWLPQWPLLPSPVHPSWVTDWKVHFAASYVKTNEAVSVFEYSSQSECKEKSELWEMTYATKVIMVNRAECSFHKLEYCKKDNEELSSCVIAAWFWQGAGEMNVSLCVCSFSTKQNLDSYTERNWFMWGSNTPRWSLFKFFIGFELLDVVETTGFITKLLWI